MIRVIIIEDDPMLAELAAGYLEGMDGFSLEHTAHSGEAGLALLRAHPVDLVLLDIRMPGMDGLDVLAQLAASDLPVIMLTGHGNVDLCRRAFKSGAVEFLQKPVDDDVLLDAVQKAVRQHIASRERQAATLAARLKLARLSGRELDVLQRIADGLSNKEIARELALSPRTVETYRANVFAKLEVDTLAQLIRHYLVLLAEGI